MAKQKITKKQIDHTLAFTDDVVKNYPDRLIGTPSAKAAAERIAEEFEKSCDPGTVRIEPFTCHPQFFRSSVVFSGFPEARSFHR